MGGTPLFDKLISLFRPQSSDRRDPDNRSPMADFWYKDISVDLLAQVGLEITPENALTVPAVWICNQIIAETIGSLPLLTYQTLANKGKERAQDHPLYKILHSSPNPIQTAQEWRESMQSHVNLYGNAYSPIKRDFYGEVLSLGIPLHPTRMDVKFVDGQLIYTHKSESGAVTTFSQDEILHVRGLSVDGIMGISPIQKGANSIKIAMAAELFGLNFFRKGIRPLGVVKYPSKLDQPTQANLKESIRKQADEGLLYLDAGADFQQFSQNMEEAQYTQARVFQLQECCRWFRIPPSKVMDYTKASYSSFEQSALDFVTDTILPRVKRWEQRLALSLFSDTEYFAEFLLEGLLRGDSITRANYYASLIEHRMLSPNEGRILENRSPVDGGDKMYRGNNMIPDDEEDREAAKQLPPPPPPPDDEDEEEEEDTTDEATDTNTDDTSKDEEKSQELQVVMQAKEEKAEALRKIKEYSATMQNVIVDAAKRISKAELREIEKLGGDGDKLEQFYQRHCEYIRKTLQPFGINIDPLTLTTKRIDPEWLEDEIIATLQGALEHHEIS